MARSEKMVYRVRRRIGDKKAHNVGTEIYEALQLAQQNIIARFNALTLDIDITTVEGQSIYTLPANVRSVKSIIKPTGDAWNKPIIYKLPREWDEILRIQAIGEPLYWMFNERMTEMNTHPAPTDDGETITLQCYMKDSATEIGEGVEPEIESYWDEAMVFYATSMFVEDPRPWLSLYEKQAADLRHIPTQSILDPKVKQTNW